MVNCPAFFAYGRSGNEAKTVGPGETMWIDITLVDFWP